MSARTIIHLVPHTHWDREWYRPFQSFRMQLVELVDRVLDMLEADGNFAFTLDGQLATVDDYLEIRPEAAERIARHVASGRLAIGPWQILMDEFLVSGETLVRNLEAGVERSADFGAPMPVGYLPDMFGHIAQMPQILRRAGLEHAVVWRGVPTAVDRHAFRWEAPDGSSVRAEYLPVGYGNAAGLFAVPERLEAACERLVDWAGPWFGDDPVLAMYGTDHTAPVPELAALVSGLNEVRTTSDMRVSTLAQYIAAAPALTDADPVWRGEMRSGARANLLMGVASARIDIKRAAGLAETMLERFAEPLAALHVQADAWPDAFLRLAWGRVIQNSAHDSICGCSLDPVVEQVLVRFAEAEQVASGIARRAALAVAASVPQGAVTVLNPSPVARSAQVEAELVIPDEWDEVALELPDGRRVMTQELSRKEPLLFTGSLRGDQADELFRRFHGREVFDHAWNGYEVDGRTITLHVDTDADPAWLDVDELRGEVVELMGASPDETWQVRIVASPRRRLAASVPVPALGWTAFRAVEGTAQLEHPVRVSERALSNGLLTMTVVQDGTLALETPDGVMVEGVGRIVDGGDFGDSYNYAPPAADTIVDSPSAASVDVGLAGPVTGRIRVRRTYAWPSGLAPDGSARSAETEPTEVTMTVELRAGEPFVRIGLSFENRSDDHRVRFHAPIARGAETSQAEGQFAVVERGMRPEGGYHEEPLATYPAHGWVDAGGLAILLNHLTEYELTDAPGAASGREVAITVLRSTGLISRNHHPYRQDPAGPQLAIPNAQMRGPMQMSFALFVHAGDWTHGVVAAAEAYRHPLLSMPGQGPPDAGWPPIGAGKDVLRLSADDCALTSLRRSDGWIEARLVNYAAKARSVILDGGITDARDSDMLGRGGEPLGVEPDGSVRLELGPGRIRTIQVRRRETALGRPDALDSLGPRQGA